MFAMQDKKPRQQKKITRKKKKKHTKLTKAKKETINEGSKNV